MRRWIGSLARGGACLALALAVACRAAPSQSTAPGTASTPGTQAASDIGFVTGLRGASLSPAPGEPSATAGGSDLGLVVASQQRDGTTWRRVIVADGSSGWTSRELGPVRAVRVRAGTRPFSVVSRSPDDLGFADAGDIRIDDGLDGEIVGAAQRARVAGNEQLMLPERYRRPLPWLEVKFGPTRGYTPLDSIVLMPAVAAEARSLPEALDALGITGLAWRPFLGGVPPAAVATTSTAGRTHHLDDPASEPRLLQETVEWTLLEFVFRDTGTLLAVFGDGPRRLFRFVDNGQPPLDVVLDSDFAMPAHVRRADLNGDGAAEWLLEIAARYGDGFYAVLWILDGRSSSGGRFALERLLLSHSTGERASGDVAAEWELQGDGTIEVVRDPAGERQRTRYRYGTQLTVVR